MDLTLSEVDLSNLMQQNVELRKKCCQIVNCWLMSTIFQIQKNEMEHICHFSFKSHFAMSKRNPQAADYNVNFYTLKSLFNYSYSLSIPCLSLMNSSLRWPLFTPVISVEIDPISPISNPWFVSYYPANSLCARPSVFIRD